MTRRLLPACIALLSLVLAPACAQDKIATVSGGPSDTAADTAADTAGNPTADEQALPQTATQAKTTWQNGGN